MATKRKKNKLKKRKKSAGRKTATKKRAVKKKAAAKKAAPRKGAAPRKKVARKTRVRGQNPSVERIALKSTGLGARSGGQAGDLQGLSDAARADSESVDELLEEGNAFEAEAVKGVQDAKDADEGEVRTHEVPGDDVPGEYLDDEK